MSLQFAPIRLEDQPRYHEYLSRSPQKPSDYSFANVFGWAEEYGLELAFEEHCLWIRQNHPLPVYWAPVGDWQSLEWRNCPLAEQGTQMIRVPEELVQILLERLEGQVEVKAARGHWDYVYSVPELIKLEDERFKRKRGHLQEFVQEYDWVYKSMDADCIEDALQMQEEWCRWRECEDSEALIMENNAIACVLQNWDAIGGLMGGALHVDGHMVAYTVAEPLDETTLVVHFEKGKPEFTGVYQAINQMFLEDKAAAYQWVNREQDLDDPGLRKAKLSYNPTSFMKKYSVTLKPE